MRMKNYTKSGRIDRKHEPCISTKLYAPRWKLCPSNLALEINFLTVQRLGWALGVSTFDFSWEASPLACRRLPPFCVLKRSFLCVYTHPYGFFVHPNFSSYKKPVSRIGAHPGWLSISTYYLVKSLVSKIQPHSEVLSFKTSACKFGGTITIQRSYSSSFSGLCSYCLCSLSATLFTFFLPLTEDMLLIIRSSDQRITTCKKLPG